MFIADTNCLPKVLDFTAGVVRDTEIFYPQCCMSTVYKYESSINVFEALIRKLYHMLMLACNNDKLPFFTALDFRTLPVSLMDDAVSNVEVLCPGNVARSGRKIVCLTHINSFGKRYDSKLSARLYNIDFWTAVCKQYISKRLNNPSAINTIFLKSYNV